MSTIFIDESGDLSFNFDIPRTPRFFVISALICDDPKVTNKIIKKTLQSLSPKARKNHQGKVLHANREIERTKRKLLELVSVYNLKTVSIVLDKHKHLEDLIGENKVKLYNYLAVEAILHSRPAEDVNVILSKRESKPGINKKVKADIKKLLKQAGHNATVDIKMHQSDAELMIVDFVSNAVFTQAQIGDDSLYDIISGQDKTLEAFMLSHPAPLLQGNYLSYPHYTKPKKESQA